MRQSQDSRGTSENLLLSGTMFYIEWAAIWDVAFSAIRVTSCKDDAGFARNNTVTVQVQQGIVMITIDEERMVENDDCNR